MLSLKHHKMNVEREIRDAKRSVKERHDMIKLTWSYAYQTSAQKLYGKIGASDLADIVIMYEGASTGGVPTWFVDAVVVNDNVMRLQKTVGRNSEY